MSYALVQEATAHQDAVASLDVTLAAPPTAGRLLIARVEWASVLVSVSSVTDTAGNVWRAAHPVQTASNLEWPTSVQVWFAYNCASATPHTVTVAFGASMGHISIALSEWSGTIGTGNPLGDHDSAGIPPGTLPDPYDTIFGFVTPVEAGDLIYMAVNSAAAVDADPTDSTALATVDTTFTGYYLLAPNTDEYAALISLDGDPYVFAGVVVVFKLHAAAEVWVPIADYKEHTLDAAQYPGGTARVTCELWTEDLGSPLPTITARLVSLLTTRDADGLFEVDAEVGRSATLQTAVPAEGGFPVTLAGIKRHRLEVTSDTPEVDLFCAPGAEVTL